MADTTHTIGSTGIVKKLVDLGDGTYADAVADANPALSTEVVVAGAASVLGKLSTVVDGDTVFVRAASSPCRDIEWRVKADQVHTVQKYKARTVVDSVTLTLDDANALDDTDSIWVNGIELIGTADAATCLKSAYKFHCPDTTRDLEAASIAALINAGKTILCTSAIAGDQAVVNGLTFEGKAGAAAFATRMFSIDTGDSQTAISLAAGINHKANITCATVLAAQTIIINGLTFTGGAAENLATRTFDRSAGDNATATSLAACINSATYGVTGVTASAGTNIVTLTCSLAVPTLVVSHGNAAAAITMAYVPQYGVPGVAATAVGKEVSLVKTWATTLTATSPDATIVCADYGVPGVTATAAAHVVTLVPTTASTIYAKSGTAEAAECVIASTTLTGLAKDGAAVTAIAANNSTAGTLYTQTMNGWEQGYLGITNNDAGGDAMTLVVGATVA